MKTKKRIATALSKIVYRAAVKGAGLASQWGMYQPKVPKKLSK